MAETITKQDFLENTQKAVTAILKKHRLPEHAHGGVIKGIDLWGFVLREGELMPHTLKELHGIAADAAHELGDKPAIVVADGNILIGFVGKPKHSLFKF